MYIDSHCHLDFEDLAIREDEILAAMRAAKVTHALCIGVNLENIQRVISLAERHAHLYASVGVHPDGNEGEEPTLARLLALADHSKVIAIGETGLDYYWHKDQPEWQRERFRVHIEAAKISAKPLVIHTRDSAEDTLRIMRECHAEECGGVMHCFTENWEVASVALDLGFYISFSGIVTFKNAKTIQDVACKVPLDRLLIETDSPYLAPVPHRGKTNEPAFVVHVAEHIGKLRNLPLETIAAHSSANFNTLFKLETKHENVARA